jgi:hypothetical protein
LGEKIHITKKSINQERDGVLALSDGCFIMADKTQTGIKIERNV